ncbi:MAG: nucleoside-diphosphate kinase [Verrucomicrobia bacterium]|jgi:nucleoside diphosphate kinase|nr:nucleoside-diphosphate kinase [Verrucomicrobiota bacterium]
MSEQLSYVIITPYSLLKSRTGGIISRLIARTGLDLVAARMFSPSAALTREYANAITSDQTPENRRIQELIRDYILERFGPDARTGRGRRVMMLVFRGDDAVRKTFSVVGHISPGRSGGETIRDTYGDVIMEDNGSVRYFEPAALAAPTPTEAESRLKLWARYSDSDGGVLENVNAFPEGQTPQRTLVLIKPENFRFASGRPGRMIDHFSKTGLYIVGIKLHQMSVEQACEFYGPVREVLRTKLKDMVAAKAKDAVEKDFGFALAPEVVAKLGDVLGPAFGDNQFENIVRFMSGRAPSECPEAERARPGSEKCFAIIYEGIEAVRKIRDVLGPTDPSKAPPGSIRREFGSSVMVNAAHASDSPENAKREMDIIKVTDNDFKRVIESFYGKL